MKLDPSGETSGRMKLILVSIVSLLTIQPILNLASVINSWALERTTIQFQLRVDGKQTDVTPEMRFNGDLIRPGGKVQPGNGVIEVNDIRFMPVRHQVQVRYGRAANAGNIELTAARGKVEISSDPLGAEFLLKNQTHEWSGSLPFATDIPTGDYHLVTRRHGWEINTNISIVRGVRTTHKVEFIYGSVEVTSNPSNLLVLTNGVEAGRTPLTLEELRPGHYVLSATDGENNLIADIDVGPRDVCNAPQLGVATGI